VTEDAKRAGSNLAGARSVIAGCRRKARDCRDFRKGRGAGTTPAARWAL